MRSINVIAVCFLLTVISISVFFALQTIYGQTASFNSTQINSTTSSQPQWKVYTNNKFGFSIEHPQSWLISEKQSRFESGVDLTIESPDISNPNHGAFTFSNAGPTPTNNIRILMNMVINEMVGGFDLDYDRRLIENANITRYKIDGENAGAFVIVLDSKELGDSTPVPVTAAEIVMTIHNGKSYLFQFMSRTEDFDSPSLTGIRQHMFNSIKWLN